MKEKNLVLERGDHRWSDDSIRLILTPSSTAKRLYFYTQEVGYFKTSYPYFSERQNLNSFLLVYTVSGTGHLEYRENVYTLTAGQCFLINCEEHHLYRADQHEDWEILWIHFNGNNALGYYEELMKNGFAMIKCNDTFFMERTLWQIIASHQKKNSTTEIVVSNLIHNLLSELLVETATSSVSTFVIPDYIQQIAREIDKNFKTELSLSYFENLCHRSRYHILKEFKKYMGITIHEYIITARLNYSKELLKYSTLSVSDITYAIGMNNVSHYIRLFKDREDLTPLAYRKQWQD